MEFLKKILSKLGTGGPLNSWLQGLSIKALERLLYLFEVACSLLCGLLGAVPVYALLESNPAKLRYGLAGVVWLLVSVVVFFLVDRCSLAGRIRRL
jgi:hypothetical protein